MRAGRCAGALVLGLVGACLGCTYEREVSRRHPLAGLPGVKTGSPETSRAWSGYDPTILPNDALVVEQPDGSVKLMARSARHLMVHIYNTLKDDDEALFTSQVLSDMTKREYQDRGLDPAEAYRTLRKRSDDVVALFNLMPAGEQTPGVYWHRIGQTPEGKPIMRVSLGSQVRHIPWNFMDMTMEGGNWKLRWFGRE